MGHQIIRQPDGKLAVFSSVVDSWVLFDASPADIENYYAEKAAEDARQNTRRLLDAVMSGEPKRVYHQFALTFEKADALSAEHGHRLADLQAGIGVASP